MGSVTNMDRPTPNTPADGKASTPAGEGAGYSTTSKSGIAMDRTIEKPRRPLKTAMYAAAGLLIFTLAAWQILEAGGGRALKVQSDRIAVSTVITGTFEDFIPVRGRVTPLKTVFLDAIEGGRVDRVLVEDGTIVKAGDPIVVLSNTNLQLDVTRNEALVTEQLNNMRTIELQLEQNRLDHKRNLNDFNYNIRRLTRLAARQRELVTKGAVAVSLFEDTEDELAYNIARRDLTLESQATDARLQEQQLVYLRESSEQLQANLTIARANLENLNVKAPVDGKLSGFSVEVGQSITRGGRLGQIDDPSNYKLSADIDEFYLGRVDLGQTAVFERGGTDYRLTVAKIYPQVTAGQFQVDMEFKGGQPDDIRRGQTIQTKLTLGDAEPALLIPNGAFYQDTGGAWLFVVNNDGTEAVRRPVRLGRRNSRYIEVIEGLEAGERVVTSPYTSYRDMDRLKLD